MIYGVAFTQTCDNDLIGILLFKNEAKAKLALRVMLGMEELSSLDENLETIFESSDFEEIPEIEEDELQEQLVLQRKTVVKIVNMDEIPDID